MTLHIAFQGGTHGHFLRYFLDRFSRHTPVIKDNPFLTIGTSHNSEITYSENFDLYHPTLEGFCTDDPAVQPLEQGPDDCQIEFWNKI